MIRLFISSDKKNKDLVLIFVQRFILTFGIFYLNRYPSCFHLTFDSVEISSCFEVYRVVCRMLCYVRSIWKHMEMSPLSKNVGPCSAPIWPLIREGSLSCHTCSETSVFAVSSEGPFQSSHCFRQDFF